MGASAHCPRSADILVRSNTRTQIGTIPARAPIRKSLRTGMSALRFGGKLRMAPKAIAKRRCRLTPTCASGSDHIAIRHADDKLAAQALGMIRRLAHGLALAGLEAALL